MKKALCHGLIIISLLFISCDSNKKEETSEETTKKDLVELILEINSPLNDKFKIYYTKEANSEITGEHFIEKRFYGSSEMQKVVFQFPNGDMPHKIRLDVGVNQKAENITIKNISVAYKDKLINGNEGEFMKFWSTNECLKFNENDQNYTVIPANGQKTPIFIANVELEKELKKIRK